MFYIAVPPTIRGENGNDKVSVILNHDVSLVCHVTGIPPPDVTWLKHQTPIADDNRKYILSSGKIIKISFKAVTLLYK